MTQELRSLYEITGDIKDINTVLVQRDRLEKAEQDAERYRWLRDTGTQGFSNGVPQRGVTIAMDGSVKLHFVYWMTQQQLDKSIDEAMEASK